MSTESTDSLVDDSTAIIDKKNDQKAHHEERTTPKTNRPWDWKDALYLLALVALVIAMALRYTPNFTGQIAGMWWDPLLNMWTLS